METTRCPARFVQRMVPSPAEPLDLFLIRLADCNALGGPRALLRDVGLPATARSRHADLRRLVEVLDGSDLTLSLLERSARWRDAASGRTVLCGRHLPSTVLGRPLGRTCPACLEEGTAYRWTWDIKTIVACERHFCWLRDRCARCALRLDWNRSRRDACRCGAPFSEPTAEAPPAAVSLSARLGSDEACPALPMADAADLVWFAAVRESGRVARGATIDRPAIGDAWALLSPVARILEDWPRNLADWIAERHHAEARSGSLYLHVPILAELRQTFAGRSQAVMDAAADAVRSGSQYPPVRPVSSFYRPGAASLDASTTARLMGIAPESVARRIGTGALRGRVNEAGRRRATSVPRTEAVRRPPPDTLKAAAALLGITATQARELRESGHLAQGEEAGDSARVLMGRLERRATEPVMPDDPIALSAVPALRGPTLATAVALVLAGTLPAALTTPAPGPLLRRIHVSRSDVLRLAAGGLSVREVAGMLKVPVRLVPKLVASGCIDVSAGPSRRGIDEAAVRRCSVEFATGGEMAAFAGTNSRTLLERLRDAGIRPVVPADPPRGISSVWRRKEVEEFVWAAGGRPRRASRKSGGARRGRRGRPKGPRRAPSSAIASSVDRPMELPEGCRTGRFVRCRELGDGRAARKPLTDSLGS